MLATFFKKTQTVWRLPQRKKAWVLILYPLSGVIRLAILTLPYKILSKYYGNLHSNTQLSIPCDETQKKIAWEIGKITDLIARHTPWKSECLVQALMVKTLLKYYQIPHTLHLGALMCKDPEEEPMKAHAWVLVGPWIVCGAEGHEAFSIVATFTSIDLQQQGAASRSG